MEIYSLIVTHVWLVMVIVLYVGYLTYADYYDKLSESFIHEFTLFSVGITSTSILFGVANLPDNPEDFKWWNLYIEVNIVCSFQLIIGFIVLFIRNAHSIRQYFGRKRNKV